MKSYENLLVLTADNPGSRALMSRVELEFEALWSDGWCPGQLFPAIYAQT